MSAYTIKAVGEPKPWSNDFGSFLSYPVDLEDEQGKKLLGVEWNRKSDSQPPQIDDRIAGHIEPGRFADKLKVDFEATKELKGGGSTGSSGGKFSGQHGGKSPDTQASIVRQHSQEMALRFVALGLVQPKSGKDADETLDALRPIIDWFEADANQAASGGGSGTTSGAPSASAPPQASDNQGVHELLYELFQKAGEAAPIATLLTDWVVSTQAVDKQATVLTALRDDGARRAKCVQWARAGYEKANGPLPTVSDNPDDSIPF